jgi:hypothetical protein
MAAPYVVFWRSAMVCHLPSITFGYDFFIVSVHHSIHHLYDTVKLFSLCLYRTKWYDSIFEISLGYSWFDILCLF